MHPAIFDAFDAICRQEKAGGRVLEIGAVPTSDTLLALPSLAGASRKIGVNLAPASRGPDFEIIETDANALTPFEDDSFDLVLSNSMLEHDRRFWLTLAEIRRVARPGALIAIGVPGYADMRRLPFPRLRRFVPHLPVVGRSLHRHIGALQAGTSTLGRHDFPGDYYRFSEQAMREVLLADLERPAVRRLLDPPRFLGWARMPGTKTAR